MQIYFVWLWRHGWLVECYGLGSLRHDWHVVSMVSTVIQHAYDFYKINKLGYLPIMEATVKFTGASFVSASQILYHEVLFPNEP